MSNNKKTIAYLIVIVFLIVASVIGITFAYFESTSNITATADITASTGTAYTFTSSASNGITINALSSDMMESDSGNYVSGNGELSVSLNASSSSTTICTFDLLWVWTSTDKYTASSVTLPYIKDDTTYNYEFSTTVYDKYTSKVVFNERDLSKVNNGTGFTTLDSTSQGTIAEGLEISADAGESSSINYRIEARLYNIPAAQDNLINKNMQGFVKVENVNCVYGEKLSSKILMYSDPTSADSMYASKSAALTAINAKTKPDFSLAATTNEGMYAESDDDGTSYYFRGAVVNNWVSFGGFYWRIIRINGDGTIRMIYSGTKSKNSGSYVDIGTSAYNTTGVSRTQTHTSGTMYKPVVNGVVVDSDVKRVIDTWYNTNLLGYDSKIATSMFCNDYGTYSSTEPSSGSLNYAKYYDFDKDDSHDPEPSLLCNSNGKIINLKVALITADEASFAGNVAFTTKNTSNYLYSNGSYWTMTPIKSTTSDAYVFTVGSSGTLSGYYVAGSSYVRPVINLKSSTLYETGNGTVLNPFIVS